MNYLTKENITLSISIIGFAISIFNFFESRYRQHIRLEFAYKAHANNSSMLLLQAAFLNHSHLPVCVSRVFIYIGSYTYEFKWIPETVIEKTKRTGNVIEDVIKIHSLTPPFKIESLGIVGGILVANLEPTITNEYIQTSNSYIQIYTDKGVKKYNIHLSNPHIDY